MQHYGQQEENKLNIRIRKDVTQIVSDIYHRHGESGGQSYENGQE